MKKKITIAGMSYSNDVEDVIKTLQGICGVKSVEVNLLEKNLVVELVHKVTNGKLIAAIFGVGYETVEIVEV